MEAQQEQEQLQALADAAAAELDELEELHHLEHAVYEQWQRDEQQLRAGKHERKRKQRQQRQQRRRKRACAAEQRERTMAPAFSAHALEQMNERCRMEQQLQISAMLQQRRQQLLFRACERKCERKQQPCQRQHQQRRKAESRGHAQEQIAARACTAYSLEQLAQRQQAKRVERERQAQRARCWVAYGRWLWYLHAKKCWKGL